MDLRELSLYGLRQTLNDQVGYISVARNFVETGQLTSNIIYPSFLGQHATKNYLYVPGQYLALALSYRLFGFGVLALVLPSMIGFIVAAVGVLLIASRFFGNAVGTLAAVFFIFFPGNLVYALTAMSEMTLVGAAMLGLVVFVYLPDRWKVFAGPAALVPALLFRETGALFAIPMLVLIAMRRGKLDVRAGALFALVASAVVLGVWLSDVGSGRPSLFLVNIFASDDQSVYGNAFALQAIHPSAADWLHAVLSKFISNARLLGGLLLTNAWLLVRRGQLPATGDFMLELTGLGLVLFGVLCSAWVAVRRRDPISVGGVLMTTALLCAVLLVYSIGIFRGLRMLLLAVPFLSISWARLAESGFRRLSSRGLHPRWTTRLAWLGTCAVVASTGLGLTYSAFAAEEAARAQSHHDGEFLESLGHNDTYVLVAPWQLAIDYVYQHHPVRWSFLPANRETLALLDSRYPIGTILLPADNTGLTQEDILESGFVQTAERYYAGHQYLVYGRRHS